MPRRELPERTAGARTAEFTPNRRRAADLLGIGERTLYRKLEICGAAVPTTEQGKPIKQAMGEVFVGIAQLRHYAAQRGGTRVISETDTTRIIEHRTPR